MNRKLYRQIKLPINSTHSVVQNRNYEWGVIDDDGNVIVPFGKYKWIDGFQNGFAKVIGHADTTDPGYRGTINFTTGEIDHIKTTAQGIIDEDGR